MSDLVKDAVDVADKLSADNDDVQRKKRFEQYAVRGINKKVSKQIMRDFTKTAEDDLVTLANSVNADEMSYDLRDVLARWFINTFVGKFLRKLIDSQRIICDGYNYFGDTIKKIFAQARSADSKYANKIGGKSTSIAESNVNLLTQLNSAFTYYEKNKEYGCSASYALTNLYEEDNDTQIEIDKLLKASKPNTIKDFAKDENNINVFDDCSEKIYEEYGLDDESFLNSSMANVIKGNEKAFAFLVNEIIKRYNKQFEKEIGSEVEDVFEDEEVSKMMIELIKATGITGAVEGTVKIYLLKQAKAVIYSNYKELFNQINTNKSTDYERLKMLYNELKSLEKSIINAYKDINEFNPNNQVTANDWLGQVNDCSCGSL